MITMTTRRRLLIPLIAVSVIFLAVAIAGYINDRRIMRSSCHCVSEMRFIDSAKEQLAYAQGLKDGDIVTTNDVRPYIKGGTFGFCLYGGSFTLGRIGEDPSCSIHGRYGGLGHDGKPEGINEVRRRLKERDTAVAPHPP